MESWFTGRFVYGELVVNLYMEVDFSDVFWFFEFKLVHFHSGLNTCLRRANQGDQRAGPLAG
jgi:hypothetical protein